MYNADVPQSFLGPRRFLLIAPTPSLQPGEVGALQRLLLLLLFFLLSISDPHVFDIQLLLLLPLRSNPINQFLCRETNFMENFEASTEGWCHTSYSIFLLLTAFFLCSPSLCFPHGSQSAPFSILRFLPVDFALERRNALEKRNGLVIFFAEFL